MIGYCYSFDNGLIYRTAANDLLTVTNNPKVVYNISVGVWIATLYLYVQKSTGASIATTAFCNLQLIFDTVNDPFGAANGVINCYPGSMSIALAATLQSNLTLTISGPVIITKQGNITSWGSSNGFRVGTSTTTGMKLTVSFLRIA